MQATELVAGGGTVVTLTRGILWSVFAGAIALGAGGLAFGGLAVGSGLASGHTALSLIADGAMPENADAGTATIVSGAFDTASVVVGDLSAAVVALATAAKVAAILTGAAVAASVALLAWRLLRRAPFRRSLSLTVTIAGAVLLIGGVFSAGAGSLAAAMAAGELNASTLDGFWPIAGRVDGSSIALGVVLLLVGLAFEHGERLQRDTEGLV
jgi:hypothetical protein